MNIKFSVKNVLLNPCEKATLTFDDGAGLLILDHAMSLKITLNNWLVRGSS